MTLIEMDKQNQVDAQQKVWLSVWITVSINSLNCANIMQNHIRLYVDGPVQNFASISVGDYIEDSVWDSVDNFVSFYDFN